MSEMNNEFEQMLDESFKTIRNGEVLEGKVISVKPEEAVLNIGYKADGILPVNEYSNTAEDLTTEISVGDELTVKVLKVNDGEGQVALSYKRLAAEKANKRLEEAFENNEVLKAPVVQILKGGLSVDVEGARVFIPASLVSDVFERDLSKYEGEEIEFVLTEYNPRKRRVIGDRKQVVSKEKEEARAALLEKVSVGDSITGTVKSVVDFGAFVDIGGVDGLLHISEMSWGRIGNPRKHFKPGDEVTAFIKEINEDKIALSLKFEDTNPWNNASEKFAVGAIVTGTVARMTDFGCFVEIEPGVDALLHVSQIARHHVDKPSDELKVGDVIEAKIVEFNEDEKKISLSRKVLLPEEPKEEPEEEKEEIPEMPDQEETPDSSIADAIAAAKEDAGDAVDKIKEAAQDQVEEVKEKAESQIEEVKDEAKEQIEEVKEEAAAKQEEVKEQLEEAKDAAQDQIEELKEKAEEQIAEVKEKAEEQKEVVKEKAEEQKEVVKEKAEEVIDKVEGKLEELKEKLAGSDDAE